MDPAGSETLACQYEGFPEDMVTSDGAVPDLQYSQK